MPFAVRSLEQLLLEIGKAQTAAVQRRKELAAQGRDQSAPVLQHSLGEHLIESTLLQPPSRQLAPRPR